MTSGLATQDAGKSAPSELPSSALVEGVSARAALGCPYHDALAPRFLRKSHHRINQPAPYAATAERQRVADQSLCCSQPTETPIPNPKSPPSIISDFIGNGTFAPV